MAGNDGRVEMLLELSRWVMYTQNRQLHPIRTARSDYASRILAMPDGLLRSCMGMLRRASAAIHIAKRPAVQS